jgi:hypothetical protein
MALDCVVVAKKTDPDSPIDDEDRIAIPLDPVDALRALLEVDPESEPAESDQSDSEPRGSGGAS